MKRIISIMIAVIMLVCSFSLPSFALNYGSFSYEIINDEVVITKYIGSNRTSITVPATIKDVPVVAIGEGAFKGNTELTTVEVSEGVKSIGASVFENCTSLATIMLPNTITRIGEKAIYNTAYYNNESNWKKQTADTSSGDIGFGNGMGQIPWEDIVANDLEYLYLGTNLIEISFSGSYSLKKGTRVIADGAFAGCNAASVTLSNTLVAIGENAFKDCTVVTSVTIGSSVSTIGTNPFIGCESLKEINFIFNAGEGKDQTADLWTDEDVCYTWQNGAEVKLEDCGKTPIENVVVEDIPQLDVNKPMYNVLGQQVNVNYIGIIIQNGYKYIR